MGAIAGILDNFHKVTKQHMNNSNKASWSDLIVAMLFV